MNRKTTSALLLLLASPLVAPAAALEDENAQLRAQIAALKARNEVLERACPAAAASPAPASAAPAPTPQAPATMSFAPAANPPAAAPLPPPAPPPPPPAPPPPPPASTPMQPYAEAGCDRGFLHGPAPGKWQQANAWKALHNGMSMAEVEGLIGVEHYDVAKGTDTVQWQYGRCAASWQGSVTFRNGSLVSSDAP